MSLPMIVIGDSWAQLTLPHLETEHTITDTFTEGGSSSVHWYIRKDIIAPQLPSEKHIIYLSTGGMDDILYYQDPEVTRSPYYPSSVGKRIRDICRTFMNLGHHVVLAGYNKVDDGGTSQGITYNGHGHVYRVFGGNDESLGKDAFSLFTKHNFEHIPVTYYSTDPLHLIPESYAARVADVVWPTE